MAESSFDVVSKVEEQELANAIDMVYKELENRFDFKGSPFKVERTDDGIQLEAKDDMKMQQLIDTFQSKLVKRNISLKAIAFGKYETNVSGLVKCHADLQDGLSQEQCKKINKLIKDLKLKVQSRVQGDAVRVTGKSRDDLQAIQKAIRDADFEFDTSFDNYR